MALVAADVSHLTSSASASGYQYNTPSVGLTAPSGDISTVTSGSISSGSADSLIGGAVVDHGHGHGHGIEGGNVGISGGEIHSGDASSVSLGANYGNGFGNGYGSGSGASYGNGYGYSSGLSQVGTQVGEVTVNQQVQVPVRVPVYTQHVQVPVRVPYTVERQVGHKETKCYIRFEY